MVRAARVWLLLLLALPGCSCFRLTAGVGLGLGGSVRLGVLDVGFLGGAAYEGGNTYGLTGGQLAGELGLPLVGRVEFLEGNDEHIERRRIEGPFGIFCLLEHFAPDCCFNRKAEIAVAVYAGIVTFHLGFDPEELVRLVFGIEKAPPLIRSGEEERDPVDASARVLETPAPPLALDGELDEREALVRARNEGRTTIYVSPWLALLERLERKDGALGPAVKAEEERSEKELAQAFESRDPSTLARAIGRAPLARRSREAARRVGELRLERGDLDEALEAFALEARLAKGDEERAAALARADLAQKALGDRGRCEVVLSATPSRLVTVGGTRIAALGVEHWGYTLAGDIAFLRSDLLAEGESFSGAIAATSELALLEADPAGSSGRKTIVAVDEPGNERWRAELPASPEGEPWRYVCRGGRLHAVSRTLVVTLDGETGRYEWVFHRKELERSKEVPFESALVATPSLEGEPVRFAGDVLEWRTDAWGSRHAEPDRLERVDPRTGFPVGPAK